MTPEVDFQRRTLVVVSWGGSTHGCRGQIEAIPVDGANMPVVFTGEVPDTTGSGG